MQIMVCSTLGCVGRPSKLSSQSWGEAVTIPAPRWSPLACPFGLDCVAIRQLLFKAESLTFM